MGRLFLMRYIERQLTKEIQSMMTYYPIVTVIGPRQSGKSTLVQMLYPDMPYVSLEDPDTRRLAMADPRNFLERFPEGGILDEIQRCPELLSYLQSLVDRRKQNGLFILTGSHQLALHEAITQSLAGRTAIIKLLPFSMQELKAFKTIALDDYLFQGMYPRLYEHDIPSPIFYRDYLQTYLERDVRLMINVKDLSIFQQFMHLCSGLVGQILNYDSLSNMLGVSSHTIKQWISVLEASFIIFRLQPYYENFGKRIIKSHKLYFYDVGLASFLADIHEPKQLQRDPLRGHLFENFIILEILKNHLNQGIEPSMYFYRDSNQNEIDLILKSGNKLIPIEIKSSKTYNHFFLKGLSYFKNLTQERCAQGYIIYTGEQEQSVDGFKLINYLNISEITTKIIL